MIAIYGATGLAGEMICRELAKRGSTIRICGRDRRRLDALAAAVGGAIEVRVAHVHDAAALRLAFTDARVVVSAAGPFSRVGAPVLEAAIAVGAHYVDICGEQPFLRAAYERFEAAAHKRGVVCVGGLAFRAAIGDWASALADQRLKEKGRGVDRVTIATAIRKSELTARETATAAIALSQPALIWVHDRWERVAPGAERRRFAFGERFGEGEAILFGGGEVVTVPRHIQTREVKTFLWIATENPLLWQATRIAPLLSPLIGPLISGPLSRFVRAQAEAVRSPSHDRARVATEFAVVAEAQAGFERSRVAVTGRDPYQLSAEVCSAGALALAKRPLTEGGLFTPAQAFDARARLYSLASREMVEVEES